MIFLASKAPADFPKRQFDLNISPNSSLSAISEKLVKNHIISSTFLFKIVVTLLDGRNNLLAGDYRFTESENIFTVANRIAKGIQGLPKITIMIPEGTNVYDMAYIYLMKLPDFNAPKFVGLALKDEGYLFPDTYCFFSNVSPEQIIKEMKANFDKKIASLQTQINTSGRSLNDIVIMASIVEKETNDFIDKKIIAGILWKRLSKGMYLQVDAPFYYITGKSGGFTSVDLKIKSPYNTYLNKGLPKGPISNPGIDSIKAVIDPTSTSYLFYLTGKDGLMRYANTYDAHLANKDKYLK